jgi:nitroimidazol reductase NimA-like FMN-containing flavoprotein (pyridoxamine 5'-phosphate oxidase superfamily)
VRHGSDGWRVVIVDAGAREVSTRACGSEAEARTYASTVRQHIEWLSEPKFREYYRISPPEREEA